MASELIELRFATATAENQLRAIEDRAVRAGERAGRAWTERLSGAIAGAGAGVVAGIAATDPTAGAGIAAAQAAVEGVARALRDMAGDNIWTRIASEAAIRKIKRIAEPAIRERAMVAAQIQAINESRLRAGLAGIRAGEIADLDAIFTPIARQAVDAQLRVNDVVGSIGSTLDSMQYVARLAGR